MIHDAHGNAHQDALNKEQRSPGCENAGNGVGDDKKERTTE